MQEEGKSNENKEEKEKKEEENNQNKTEEKKEEKKKKNFLFINKKNPVNNGDNKDISHNNDLNQGYKSSTNDEDLDKLMKATSQNSKAFEALNNMDKNKENMNQTKTKKKMNL